VTESVVVGDEASAWLAGLPVEPDSGSEGKRSLADASDEPGQAIASGHSWQGLLGDVVEAVFAESQAPTVVEAGSNLGASLIEIKRVRPEATVYCFEPSNRFADVLEQNVSVNQLSGVTIERLLVGSAEGSGQLFVNSSTARAWRRWTTAATNPWARRRRGWSRPTRTWTRRSPSTY
jgi:hypothetical protein